ncbi:hypothetical protein [Nostoc sp.]|uniref:hypothetical protein n=1 Tax=Nostoc sp. TaxID=1180 RepID=UPI002FF9FDF8
MYVAPTPFGLLNGVESQITLILPRDYPVDNRLVSVGEFSRMEVSQMVVGYSFDMQTNIIQPQFLPNPSIGKIHDFIAYRPAILQSINALGQQVSLKSQGEQQEVLNEAEEEEKST